MDLIRQLGPLAFASRLKRISERLHKDVSRVYDSQAVNFQARWFPVLYALKEKSRQPVTVIASQLGLTHPAINQIAGSMEKQGILTWSIDKSDERKRLLRLTSKGKKLIRELEPIWQIISDETEKVLKTSGGQILKTLDKLEAELDRQDMYDRVMRRLNSYRMDKIEILSYRPAYKKHFKALNYEWLKKYFRIEPLDEAMLSKPARYIIKPGGLILFARLNGEIIGTTAIVKIDDERFELTKMAVAPKSRGMQVGWKLAVTAIDMTKKLGAKSLVLQTSPKLKTAIALYEKLGFKRVQDSYHDLPKYRRRTFMMKLDL